MAKFITVSDLLVLDRIVKNKFLYTFKMSKYITIIIKQDIHIYMLHIAGQTAGLNGLKFFVDTVAEGALG